MRNFLPRLQRRSATQLQYTHIYITTVVIFNMVPVYPGRGSSYGIITSLSHSMASAPGRRHVVYVDSSLPGGSVQSVHKHCSSNFIVINVRLSVHKHEYKTVPLRTISVDMNAPCGLTRLRFFFRMQISGSYM